MRAFGVVVDVPCAEIGLQRFDGFVRAVSRIFTRKNSSSTVRPMRSTKPLVFGERTLVRLCSMSLSSR